MNLQLKEIKTLFDSGALKKCEIMENDDMYEKGFVLWFADRKNQQITLRTQRAAEIIKTFKNIQSAINTANDIGFKKIELILK